MRHIAQFPHCDPRILHAPGQCQYCDLHPEWQELRSIWQIAFTGGAVNAMPIERWRAEGPVLPCPADYIRGDLHVRWGGNVAASYEDGPLDEIVTDFEGTLFYGNNDISRFQVPSRWQRIKSFFGL